jgi:hypothetical protein
MEPKARDFIGAGVVALVLILGVLLLVLLAVPA